MLVNEIITPKVLIADNKEGFIHLIELELYKLEQQEKRKFLSIGAKSIVEAIDILKRESVHCIVLDLSFVDIPYQIDGIEVLDYLISQLCVVPVIILSAYAYPRNYSLVYDDLYKDLIVGVVSKERYGYLREIQDFVKTAIDNKAGIKWDLEITYHNGLDVNSVSNSILDISTSPLETTELFGKAFYNSAKIDIFPLTPGYSGTGVVKVSPSVKAVNNRLRIGETVILKFGEKHKIQKESGNYQQYVRPFVKGYRSTSLLEDPVYTRTLGALKYAIIGSDQEHFLSFSEYYRQNEVEQINKVLDNLFNDTLSIWYSDPDIVFITPFNEYKVDRLEASLRLWAKQNHPYLLTDPIINFPELDRSYKNPVLLISNLGKSDSKVLRSIIHGDLNGSNILIDPRKQEAWLIDFYQTMESHLFSDFAKLETVIKFELLENQNLKTILRAEELLLDPSNLSEFIHYTEGELPLDVEKMIAVIKTIRIMAAQYSKPRFSDASLYYLSIFYKTARALTFTSIDENRRDQILLSLCLLGERLDIK